MELVKGELLVALSRILSCFILRFHVLAMGVELVFVP